MAESSEQCSSSDVVLVQWQEVSVLCCIEHHIHAYVCMSIVDDLCAIHKAGFDVHVYVDLRMTIPFHFTRTSLVF